ncbi:MAG: RNA polymerase sigma factor [Candidatus Magasanikbacteria bacterium]|nr:RNA polymerase sigma factor [Candidatus Magasanikbacteria bacterium]
MVQNPLNFTDEQLVAEIREKDKELYSEIIRRYQTKLSHYLRKFFRNQDELEDVLQEVFIKVYRNLYGFDIDKKFSSWIYRITHNEAINHLKKNFKKNISLDEQEWEIVDEKFDLNDHIDKKQLREKISEGLFSLKEKYREPLILYYFEQKSYEEISDILRLPRNTVGVLIMRGKEKLKDSFKNLV